MTELTRAEPSVVKTCSVDGCETDDGSSRFKRGMCSPHYQRYLRHGSPTGGRGPREATCKVEDCNREPYAKGCCSKHYEQWRRTGSPTGTLRKPKAVIECSVNGCNDTGKLRRGWCNKHYLRWKLTGDLLGSKPRKPGRSGCLVDGCDRPHSCQGYCRSHYQRFAKTGDPGGVVFAQPRGVLGARVDGPEAVCRVCGLTKAADDFYSNHGQRVQPCKECTKTEHARWRQENADVLRERQVGYMLKLNFGLTVAQYEALLAAQGGGCAICGAAPRADKRRLHVDHDHQTGAIRGVLCAQCNTSIGLFGEDVRLLAKAAEYLERDAA